MIFLRLSPDGVILLCVYFYVYYNHSALLLLSLLLLLFWVFGDCVLHPNPGWPGTAAIAASALRTEIIGMSHNACVLLIFLSKLSLIFGKGLSDDNSDAQ